MATPEINENYHYVQNDPHKCRIKLGKFHFDILYCFGVIKESLPGGADSAPPPGEIGLNSCLSGISIATGISSVATFATFVRLPVSVVLGAASLTGAIASGIISTLTKKYQKKLKKITKLIDIVTPALVVFERVISGAMKNGRIDEEEFNTLQTLHLETLNELIGVDRRLEAENRSSVEKSLMEEINNMKKKNQGKSRTSVGTSV